MSYALNPDMPRWWGFNDITGPLEGRRERRRGRGPRPQGPRSQDDRPQSGDRLLNESADGREEARGRRRGRRGGEMGFPGMGPEGPHGGPGPFPGGPAGPMGHGPFPGGPGGPFPRGPWGHGPRGPRRARRGDVRLAVLHLLAEEPRNGYQMIQALAERTNNAWKPSPGAIYPALSALEDEGLIAPTGEGKVYALTDAGRQAIDTSAGAPWDAFAEAGQDFQLSQVGQLWKEAGLLAQAVGSVAGNADAAQLTRATELLARTRRDLFGLLAEEPAGDTQAEGGEPESDER